jgi:hypothetical protein
MVSDRVGVDVRVVVEVAGSETPAPSRISQLSWMRRLVATAAGVA